MAELYEKIPPGVLYFFSLVGLLWIATWFLGGLFRIINLFLIGKIMGPKIDLKKMGTWAVVTGATDGIGFEYAMQLARRGFWIALISRDQEKLEAKAQEIVRTYGVQTKIIAFDFKSEAKDYERIRDVIQPLDVGILVNSVGIIQKALYFHEDKDAVTTAEETIAVNIRSVYQMTNIVLPGMVARKRGVVVNVGAFIGNYVIPFFGVYPATKAFVSTFTKSLAAEYNHLGNIHFQCVHPHIVVTKTLREAFEPNFFLPDAKAFVESAIGTLGRASMTYGYFTHHLLGQILGNFSYNAHSKMLRRMLEEERKKTIGST